MPNPVQDWLRVRLQPAYLRLIAGAVVLIGLAMAIVSWHTSKRGTSALGIPWGADFAGFYVAAQILDQKDVSKLYDRDLHARFYHELLPNLPKEEIIPYVHPPFVAGVLRVLTPSSYDTAVAIWLVISMALYVSGVLLILRTCPFLDSQHRWLVVLLAVSFEPFLFETWLGGQLSSVAFFSYALAWYFWRRGMAGPTGMALGLCLYKPTLLILIVPMLLLARLWKVLLGMTIAGLLLLCVSLLMVGWDCTFSYVEVVLAFRKATAGNEEIAIRTWKYIDFNHFYLQLIGPSMLKTVMFIFTSLLCVGLMLVPRWWRWKKEEENQETAWACTLFLVPLINIYVGVYDSILAVQTGIIVTEVMLRRTSGKLLTTYWPYYLLMLAVVPWFNQPLAKSVGVQLYTLTLLSCAIYASRATEWRNMNSRG
ncbi:MAG TPA: glycosyltransferase family 87 protein [Gemmatales bacterium]|nr:glycosyltransferase family 87 protein [Gemmatales bacterium]